MQRFGLLIFAVLVVGMCPARNEFGELDSAKSKHPEFFRPGAVVKATLNGEEWYVYCGDAEKCFKEEEDSELYEEAEVQAKMNFFNHFAKKDPEVKVEVKGALKMYSCADASLRLVVMGVPVKNVIVTPGVKRSEKEEEVKVVAVVAPQKEVASPKPIEPAKETSGVESVPVEKSAAVEGCAPEDEILNILRQRLEKNPKDFHLHIRIARIYVRRGSVKEALNEYSATVRLMDFDSMRFDEKMIEDLFEVAKFEDENGEGAKALKHYRILLKMGDSDISKYANARISYLLLHN